MSRNEERHSHDDYMYKFRTKLCTKKRCRNPSRCFNAHSEVMRRRVPWQGEYGLYNYIPEPCPQWQKSKKCILGESCLRSHGWLEIIFHPLLYKTKMCRSSLENGVCREYGVYCAKAHNPTDIRNLVEIYGDSWKRHDDLSMREAGSSSNLNSRRKDCNKVDSLPPKRQSVGKLLNDSLTDALKSRRPERTQAREGSKTSPTLKSFKPGIDLSSPLFFTSPPLFGDSTNICDKISDLSLDGGVTNYTQLYSEKVSMDEVDDCDLMKYTKSPTPEVQRDHTLHLSGVDVSPQESLSTSSNFSNFLSLIEEKWKKGDSLDVYCKMDVNSPELNKETRPLSGYEDNSDSLFTQPSYESNWNYNFVFSTPQIIQI